MEQTVSAAEANRKFFRLLRGVREGKTYVITDHGEPVARVLPAGESGGGALGAREALLDRLARQPVVDRDNWSREELYEDDR